MNTHTQSPDPDFTGFSARHEPDSAPTPSPYQANAEDRTTLPVADSSHRRVPAPTIVGKFRILQSGAVGGMGIVYKAHDGELDRIVALKLIKGGVLATDEEIKRFHREAQAAARLNHPNIIPVYEIGQESGCPYFTMAFAPGGNLAQQRQRFSQPHAAAALVETIARAIHYAHEHGIFHRDLKPGNILFDEHGKPLVSDFGLAKLVDASLELTVPGQVLGTPAYMAPEQASGQTERISASTDVWALGVLLYELLTRERPFKGTSQKTQMHQVQTADPARPRSLNRSLDRALETVILKCLEKEPARRYPSAEALADDLARWQRGEPVQARPPSWPLRVRRTLRRYRTPALGVLLITFLLILLVAWRSYSPSEEGDRKGLEDRLAQLRRGEEVTLLGESGRPVWWRWQPRRMQARTMLDLNQVFRIYAEKQPGILELLPSAPKRYRLRAEIQHTHSPTLQGRVGIYFAHGKCPTEGETTHCFLLAAFNDRVPTLRPREPADPPLSQIQVTLPVYGETKAGVFLHRLEGACPLACSFTPAGKMEPMPWRKLEVEVTPEWINAKWEGERIEPTVQPGDRERGVRSDDLLRMASVLLARPLTSKNNSTAQISEPTAELSLGEGLGLYVEQGIAAFRSVVIEPLP